MVILLPAVTIRKIPHLYFVQDQLIIHTHSETFKPNSRARKVGYQVFPFLCQPMINVLKFLKTCRVSFIRNSRRIHKKYWKKFPGQNNSRSCLQIFLHISSPIITLFHILRIISTVHACTKKHIFPFIFYFDPNTTLAPFKVLGFITTEQYEF